MVARPEARFAPVVRIIADLFPKAYWARDEAQALVGLVRPEHVRGARWICPAPGALDHWETVQAGEPWAYLEARPDGLWMGLQAEGARAVGRAGALLEDADRLERLLAAAARLGSSSTSAALAVRLPPHGRFEERVLLGRVVETDALGRAVLRGIWEAAGASPALATGEVAALRFARFLVSEADEVALRRDARRLARAWQAVWRLPTPRRPPRSKEELDRELRAIYRASLRDLIKRDARTRARLRVEVRDLARAYREAGRARPRLLDLVMDRLGVID